MKSHVETCLFVRFVGRQLLVDDKSKRAHGCAVYRQIQVYSFRLVE